MIRYILKRILMLIPVLLGVITLVFLLNEVTPGDPAQMIAGIGATEEQIEAIREDYGLNRPGIVRYLDYLWGLVTRGDLGTSYSTKASVTSEIVERFPVTLKLAFFSVLFSCALGIPLGILSAVHRYSWIDNLSMAMALVGVSIPNFWLGLLLMIVFAVNLHWVPAIFGSGAASAWILPVLSLGICATASIARTTRSAMLDVLNQDYVKTARSKGQNELVVIVKHMFRNALIPIVTVIGSQFGHQLGGAIMIENVFGIPGIGKFMIDSINGKDYPAVLGGVVYLAIAFSIVNLVVDILYVFIDPRMKTTLIGGRKLKKKRKGSVPATIEG